MPMKKYYIFLCTVSILLTGCSGYGDEFPAATGTSEASPNLRTEQTTSASSAIVTPMPTPQHATATPVVTAISSAATQDTRLKTECLEILPDVPRDLNGVLVLEVAPITLLLTFWT